MTYQGHIKNGQILLDAPTPLPEGARVRIELVTALEEETAHAPEVEGTVWDRIKKLAGTAEGLPEDMAGHAPEAKSSSPPLTLAEKLLSIAGTVEGPEDWARNHDHYIHGTPKLP